MKNNKSQLDIFLLKRIEENREELRHKLGFNLASGITSILEIKNE